MALCGPLKLSHTFIVGSISSYIFFASHPSISATSQCPHASSSFEGWTVSASSSSRRSHSYCCHPSIFCRASLRLGRFPSDWRLLSRLFKKRFRERTKVGNVEEKSAPLGVGCESKALQDIVVAKLHLLVSSFCDISACCIPISSHNR